MRSYKHASAPLEGVRGHAAPQENFQKFSLKWSKKEKRYDESDTHVRGDWWGTNPRPCRICRRHEWYVV